MNIITRNIPNTVTLVNLAAGICSIIFASHGFEHIAGLQAWQWSCIFIGIAAVADFLDGFCARLLHAYSNLGKELDSLCDLVSFGVAPRKRRRVMARLDRHPHPSRRSAPSRQVQYRRPPDHILHRPSHPRQRHLLDRILLPDRRWRRNPRHVGRPDSRHPRGELADGLSAAPYVAKIQKLRLEGK